MSENKTREFTIRVRIGEESTSHANCNFYPNYSVYVNPKEIEEFTPGINPINAAAHEIGHVLAHAFGLRYNSMWGTLKSNEYFIDKKACLDTENEAWDVAEMMVMRRKAVQSHADKFDEVTMLDTIRKMYHETKR